MLQAHAAVFPRDLRDPFQPVKQLSTSRCGSGASAGSVHPQAAQHGRPAAHRALRPTSLQPGPAAARPGYDRTTDAGRGRTSMRAAPRFSTHSSTDQRVRLQAVGQPGAVGEGRARRLVQPERNRARRAIQDAPAAEPAVAVDRVGLRGIVGRELEGIAFEGEAAMADAIAPWHQGIARQQVGLGRGPPGGSGRISGNGPPAPIQLNAARPPPVSGSTIASSEPSRSATPA